MRIYRTRPFLAWLFLGLLFAISYGQQPLYSDNQNTKFIHPAASAGYGYLTEDWMANTLDPLPVFSGFISGLYRFNAIYLTYVIFALLLAVYVYALFGITRHIYLIDWNSTEIYVFAVLFFIAHIANMDSGLARQYILDHYLQPSLFGVFLMLSVYHFLKQRTFWATVWLAASAAFHPGAYLPASIMILSVYTGMAVWKQRPAKTILVYWSVFALLTAPLIIHYLALFSPTTPELFQQSVRILSDIRIPQHTKVEAWFNFHSVFKIIAIMLSLILVRRRSLFWIMAMPLGVILLCTAVLYIFPDHPALTFTTPWRTSVMLMPLALSIILGWISVKAAPALKTFMGGENRIRFAAMILIVLSMAVGTGRQFQWFAKYQNAKEMPVIQFVKTTVETGNTYLVPPKVSGFERFRMETGAPILINWKTHPYKDTEVIDWYERFEAASAFYRSAGKGKDCNSLSSITGRYPVTHVIIGSEVSPDDCPGLTEIYHDEYYNVFKIGHPG